MGAGLIQLVARSYQDTYLTNDPQITFFKIVYRRHTNFASEYLVQNFTSNANFGEKSTCRISCKGDLIGKIFVCVDLPAIPQFVDETGSTDRARFFAWVRHLGFVLLEKAEIEIGEKLIDTRYGEWLYIWSQVADMQPVSLDKMVGNLPEIYRLSKEKDGFRVYVPLDFWFCKLSGMALPIVALSSAPVKITISFRKLQECCIIGPTHSVKMADTVQMFKTDDIIMQKSNPPIYGRVTNYDYLTKKLSYVKIPSLMSAPSEICIQRPLKNSADPILNLTQNTISMTQPDSREIPTLTQHSIWKPHFVNAFLYVDYIYLDAPERTLFLQRNHEYLIEQLQLTPMLNVSSQNIRQILGLKHCCRTMFWVIQLDLMQKANDTFNYTNSLVSHQGRSLLKEADLITNGESRFGMRGSEFYNRVIPWAYFNRSPAVGINVYTFTLLPLSHQPASSLNASKIDDMHMLMHLTDDVSNTNKARIRNYTINYNILRISFGLGGLAF